MSFKTIVFHASAIPGVKREDTTIAWNPVHCERLFLLLRRNNPNEPATKIIGVAGKDIRAVMHEVFADDESIPPKDILYIDTAMSRIYAAHATGVGVLLIGMLEVPTEEQVSGMWKVDNHAKIPLIVNAQRPAY